MNKRTFLKQSLAVVTGSLMTPFVPPLVGDEQAEPRTNWAGIFATAPITCISRRLWSRCKMW